MLPPSQKPEGSRQAGARNHRRKMMVGVKDTSAVRSEESKSQQQAGHRKVNLNCPSDWQQLSGVASSASLGKMFKQRLRSSSIQGAFASGDGSAGMAHSFSEGALR